jgi:hypothetical protein
MNRSSFSYTPLLLPIRLTRRPNSRRASPPPRQARRHAIQQPLPFATGEPDREYVLKPSTMK